MCVAPQNSQILVRTVYFHARPVFTVSAEGEPVRFSPEFSTNFNVMCSLMVETAYQREM